MLKQDVLDLIATNLQTGSNITASKHREVEEAIVEYIGLTMVAYGRIGPMDINNGTQTNFDVNGNLISANRVIKVGKYTTVRVIIPNDLLSSTSFKVRTDIESAGIDGSLDNDMYVVLFRRIGLTNAFDLVIEEINEVTQSIYIHVEVVQL
jgi:hypothetical protein